VKDNCLEIIQTIQAQSCSAAKTTALTCNT